ncbi:hypothetical protein ACNKHT_23620 [Shigella flexneri]
MEAVAHGYVTASDPRYNLDDAGRGHRNRALAQCCAALRGRKMPVSLITMRRRCY